MHALRRSIRLVTGSSGVDVEYRLGGRGLVEGYCPADLKVATCMIHVAFAGAVAL